MTHIVNVVDVKIDIHPKDDLGVIGNYYLYPFIKLHKDLIFLTIPNSLLRFKRIIMDLVDVKNAV